MAPRTVKPAGKKLRRKPGAFSFIREIKTKPTTQQRPKPELTKARDTTNPTTPSLWLWKMLPANTDVTCRELLEWHVIFKFYGLRKAWSGETAWTSKCSKGWRSKLMGRKSLQKAWAAWEKTRRGRAWEESWQRDTLLSMEGTIGEEQIRTRTVLGAMASATWEGTESRLGADSGC